MHKFIDRYFGSDKWNIGFIKQSAEDLVVRKKFSEHIIWLDEDSADYSADPFIVNINSNIHIFYEELNFWKVKGWISQITNLDFNTKLRITGLSPKDIHFSYPYIFEEQANYYCIPETADAAEVSLYELDHESYTDLKKKKVLLKGLRYVDSSMIYYDGNYWLFTNIDGRLNELYIYYSASLGDEFIPHAQNPIPVEPKSCRGAGHLFIASGQLYRPTQNPEVRYGGSVVMNRISELTGQSFKSEVDFELFPELPYSAGIHHISFEKDLIVVDGKRRRHSLITPVHRLLKKIAYRRKGRSGVTRK